jgi:hypothetical protein
VGKSLSPDSPHATGQSRQRWTAAGVKALSVPQPWIQVSALHWQLEVERNERMAFKEVSVLLECLTKSMAIWIWC